MVTFLSIGKMLHAYILNLLSLDFEKQHVVYLLIQICVYMSSFSPHYYIPVRKNMLFLKVLKRRILGWHQSLLWHHHLTTHLQDHHSNYFCPWQVK